MTPRTADWLLDNDYQVMRALRCLPRDLPANFHDRLPGLEQPTRKGPPRIFTLAHTLLDIEAPQISARRLMGDINTYQKVSELTQAVLWALPSMLRLAAIERLADAFGQLGPVFRHHSTPAPTSCRNRAWIPRPGSRWGSATSSRPNRSNGRISSIIPAGSRPCSTAIRPGSTT